MESSIMRNASRFLREQKKNRRWRKVLICLALVVAVGTVAVLVMPGRALNQTVRVLDCQIEVHQHTSECYGGDGTTLICGLADYVAHTHNELCYNEDGELICTLPEIEGHTHTDDCYKEERILTCGLEETAGENEEVSSQEATSPEEGSSNETVSESGDSAAETVPASETETLPDVSGNEVVAENDVPAAEAPDVVENQPAPHVHTDACYTVVRTLVCGQLETVTHEHSEACFKEVEVTEAENSSEAEESTEEPVSGGDEVSAEEVVYYCGLEEHTHDESCYEEVTGTDGSTEKVLVCGLEEHAHDESCLAETAPEVIYYCGLEEHTHDESCYEVPDVSEGNVEPVLICDKEEHTHDETCLIVPIYEKLYEDASLRVTATYPATANIPENAQFIVERMAEESEEYLEYASKAAESFAENIYPQVVGVLNIGFYLEDGTEFSPEQPVTINIQFLDEAGVADGDPITVIHFAENGTEVLGGSNIDEENSTEFVTDEFSPFVIMSSRDLVTIAGEPSAIANGVNYDPKLHKNIDYLGNNGVNGDDKNGNNNDNSRTDEDQKSDNSYADDLYRISLDITGGEQVDPVDLLIVLDLSHSMETNDRDKKIWEVLNGKNGKDGLIEKFLAPNSNPNMKEEDKSLVAIAWYAGMVEFNSTWGKFRYGWKERGPFTNTESGVIQQWSTTYTPQKSWSDDPTKNPFRRKEFTCPNDHKNASTNYIAGMMRANTLLHQSVAQNGHKKIVLFISDGLPTQYYKASELTDAVWNNPGAHPKLMRYGFGTDGYVYADARVDQTIDGYTNLVKNYVNQYYYSKTGKTLNYSTFETDNGYAHFAELNLPEASPYVNETLLAFKQFKTKNPDIDFYGVGIDLDVYTDGMKDYTSNDNFKRSYTLRRMADEYGTGRFLNIQNNADLNDIIETFEQILFPRGVIIQDTLSEYVELYTTPDSTGDVDIYGKGIGTENQDYADVEVTATPIGGGTPIVLWKGYNTGKAQTNTLDGKTVVKNVTLQNATTSTGKPTQKITVTFQEDYYLSSKYTYTLSFNVRVTDYAFDTYAQKVNNGNANGYNASGESNTDYGDNKTSSGKPGFRSNDKADVTYELGGKPGNSEYPHPVVQVWGTKLVLEKVNEYGDVIGDGAVFNLLKKDGSGYSVQIKPQKSGAAYGTSLLRPDEIDGYYVAQDGTIEYPMLETGEYMLEEVIVPFGYDSKVEPIYFAVSRGNIVVDADKVEKLPTEASAYAYKWTLKEGRNYVNEVYGNEVCLKITNNFKEPKLQIAKQDASEDRNNPMLEDVEFKVYEAANVENGKVKDESKYVARGVTDANGVVAWMEAPGSSTVFPEGGIKDSIPVGPGEYYLVESSYLKGYDKAYLEPIKFEVLIHKPSQSEGDMYTEYTSYPWIKMDKDTANTGDDVRWTVSGPTREGSYGNYIYKWSLNIKNKLRKFDITLYKVRDNYTGAGPIALAGAYFELYKLGYTADELVKFEAADGTITNGKRIYPVNADGNQAGEYFITGEDGKVDLGVLEYGHYYLKEVQAPDGYNTPPVDIKFMVNEAADGNGTITVDETYVSDEYVENVVVTDDDGDEYPDLMIQVTNYRGAALPETGGEGIYLYLMSGLALVLMAAITLMYKSKFRKAGR